MGRARGVEEPGSKHNKASNLDVLAKGVKVLVLLALLFFIRMVALLHLDDNDTSLLELTVLHNVARGDIKTRATTNTATTTTTSVNLSKPSDVLNVDVDVDRHVVSANDLPSRLPLGIVPVAGGGSVGGSEGGETRAGNGSLERHSDQHSPPPGMTGERTGGAIALLQQRPLEVGVSEEPSSTAPADIVHRWLRHLDDVSREFALCGTWQKEYGKLHKEIRTGITRAGEVMPVSKRRYAVFYCNPEKWEANGLGDRVIGMTTVLAFALATGRAFVMYWPKSGRVFVPGEGGVDWSYNETMHDELAFPKGFPEDLQWAGLKPGTVRTLGPPDQPDVAMLSLMNINFDLKEALEALSFDWMTNATKNARIVVMRANRGFLTHYLRASPTLRSYGLIQPHATGCLLRFLLRPSPSVVGAIAPTAARLLSGGTFRVAVHSRLGDGWFNLSQQRTPSGAHASSPSPSPGGPPPMEHLLGLVRGMIECAHVLATYWTTPHEKMSIFFATELQALKEAVQQLLPDRVVVMDVKTSHINSPDGLESSVHEWFLLAMCNHFVISRSGMSRSAAFYGGGEKKIFQFPRDLGHNLERKTSEGTSREGKDDIRALFAALANNKEGEPRYDNNQDRGIRKYCMPWRPFSFEQLQDWSGM